MEATMKKIRMVQPYLVGAGHIVGSYQVMVTFPDGKRKTFLSEEHAKAAIEKRTVDQPAVAREVPAEYWEALSDQPMQFLPSDETVEEKTEVDVVLVSFGDSKISVVKAVREATSLGLKEVKALVESCPAVIREALDVDEAKALAQKLRELGATVELK